MTSAQQVTANRANARKSRGPRTVGGKARSSGNARRHGLAAITRFNPAGLPEIERVAHAICGEVSNPALFEQALIMAECQMVIKCVRAERIAVIEWVRGWIQARFGDDPVIRSETKFHRELSRRPFLMQSLLKSYLNKIRADPGYTQPEVMNEFEAMVEAMPELERIARYERRAWSRRKRAFLRFIEIKAGGTA